MLTAWRSQDTDRIVLQIGIINLLVHPTFVFVLHSRYCLDAFSKFCTNWCRSFMMVDGISLLVVVSSVLLGQCLSQRIFLLVHRFLMAIKRLGADSTSI